MGPEQPSQKRCKKERERETDTPKRHGPSRSSPKAKKPPLLSAQRHQFLIVYRELNSFTFKPRHTLTSYHAMPWLGLHCVYGCNFFKELRDFGIVLQLSVIRSDCVPYQPLINDCPCSRALGIVPWRGILDAFAIHVLWRGHLFPYSR